MQYARCTESFEGSFSPKDLATLGASSGLNPVDDWGCSGAWWPILGGFEHSLGHKLGCHVIQTEPLKM